MWALHLSARDCDQTGNVETRYPETPPKFCLASTRRELENIRRGCGVGDETNGYWEANPTK